MADAPEGNAESAGGGQRSGSMSLVVILLVVVCLLMTVQLFLTITKGKGGEGAQDKKKEEAAPKPVTWDPPEDFEKIFTTKDNKALQMMLQLDVASQEAAKTLTTERVRVTDCLIRICLRKNLGELDPDRLGEDIKAELDKLLGEADQVLEVRFAQFRKQG